MKKEKLKKIIFSGLFILCVCVFLFIIILLSRQNRNEKLNFENFSYESQMKSDAQFHSGNSIISSTNISSNEEKSSSSSSRKEGNSSSSIKESSSTVQKEDLVDHSSKADSKPPVVEKSLEEKNDEKRKILEAKYEIKIRYGKELSDYKPRGLTPVFMTDFEVISKHLTYLENCLSKYPKGFFKDFIDMPLTIYLIKSIPNNAFSGLTDKEFYDDIKITLVENSLLSYTLNHEIMHYIDAYLNMKMYPKTVEEDYIKWNPERYQYGSFIKEYNYNMQSHNKGAYFISNYAQTNYAEDRAEVFKMMMSRATPMPGCFDEGEIIWNKAKVISDQIKAYFPSAMGNAHWDRFL